VPRRSNSLAIPRPFLREILRRRSCISTATSPRRLAPLRYAKLPLPLSARPSRRRHRWIYKAGCPRQSCGRPWTAVLRPSVAPTPFPAHPPISLSPTLGPRTVPWCIEPFPRPTARELPAPGSGGGGANAGFGYR